MKHPRLDEHFLKPGQQTLRETALHDDQDKIGWHFLAIRMQGYLLSTTSWVAVEVYRKKHGTTPNNNT
jgi:hypothetical protein